MYTCQTEVFQMGQTSGACSVKELATKKKRGCSNQRL